MSCSSAWSARIADGLAEGFSPAGWDALRAHLASCAACRSHYDRASAAVAHLEGRSGLVTEAARRAGKEALFESLGLEHPSERLRSRASEPNGQLPQPKDEATHRIHSLFRLREQAPPVVRPARRWVAWAGLAAAAAAALVLVQVRESTTHSQGPGASPSGEGLPEGFAARGAAGADVDFKVFCLEVQSTPPRIRAVGSPLGEPARCAVEDRFQLTWSSRVEGPQALHVFAADPTGTLVWLWPKSPTTLVGPAADTPLPGSFSLTVPGGYRIFAVTGAALDAAEASAWWALGGGGPGLLPGQVVEAKLEVQ